MRALVLGLLLLGCAEPTPVVAPLPEVPAAVPVVPSEAEAPVLASPGALEGTTWMYFESVPAASVCGFSDGGYAARCDPHIVGDPRTYEAEQVDGVPHLVRRDGDVVVFDTALDPMAGATALVTELDLPSFTVWIAGVREGDVVLAQVDGNDGRLVGVTRIAHLSGQPATGVRISRRADEVVLHVRASEPWLASMRASDRRLLDVTSAGVRMEDFTADRRWVRAARRAALTEGEVAYRASVRRVEGPGWVYTMEDPFRCRAFALAVSGSELLVAHHCPATSGASLAFLDRETGALNIEIHPGTVGTIGHSAYGSAIDLAVESDRIYLRGDESGGRYTSIIDGPHHATLAVMIWRS